MVFEYENTMAPTAPVWSGDSGGDREGGAPRPSVSGESEGWSEVRSSGRPARMAPAVAPGVGASPRWEGSRSWALSEVSDDEVSEAEESDGSGDSAGRRGAESRPAFGEFVALAEELGGSLKAGR